MSIVSDKNDVSELELVKNNLIKKFNPCCDNCMYFTLAHYCANLGWEKSIPLYDSICSPQERKNCLCENFYPRRLET